MNFTKLTYKQALEVWNGFMNESGIRAHCQNICKGKCCYLSDGEKRVCGGDCQGSLFCTVFLCLTKFFWSDHEYYEYLNEIVGKAWEEAEKYNLPILGSAFFESDGYSNPTNFLRLHGWSILPRLLGNR